MLLSPRRLEWRQADCGCPSTTTQRKVTHKRIGPSSLPATTGSTGKTAVIPIGFLVLHSPYHRGDKNRFPLYILWYRAGFMTELGLAVSWQFKQEAKCLSKQISGWRVIVTVRLNTPISKISFSGTFQKESSSHDYYVLVVLCNSSIIIYSLFNWFYMPTSLSFALLCVHSLLKNTIHVLLMYFNLISTLTVQAIRRIHGTWG